MKNFTIYIFLFISGVVFSQTNTPCSGVVPIATPLTVGASCSYTTVNNIGTTQESNAANGGTPSCSVLGEDAWYSFIAPATGAVSIETLAGTITDASMAVYSGTCGSLTEVECDDDDGAGAMPRLDLPGLTPGVQYFIRIWDFAGGTGSFDLCIGPIVVPPANQSCDSPEAVCSGTPINFTALSGSGSAAAINPGNDYGCLGSTPNPTWYYLEIATGGDLAIDITAGSDIDFAIYGPFTSVLNAEANCGSYGAPVDCSFSTAAVEQANVNGVLAGEVYILLVTNYANSPQSITLVDAGTNTATTDCSIVGPLPIELISFSAQLKDRTVELEWITGSELNNKVFEVQRRAPEGYWETIDILAGAGNSNANLIYTSEDQMPFEDINYYRIKQTDFDGKFTFSDVVSTNNSVSEQDISLYPNPAKESVVIRANQKMNSLQIVDLSGKVVLQKENIKTNSQTLILSHILPGSYIVNINTIKGSAKKKLIVQ